MVGISFLSLSLGAGDGAGKREQGSDSSDETKATSSKADQGTPQPAKKRGSWLAFRLPHREDDDQSSPDQLSADDDSSRGSGSTAGVIGMSRLTPRGNLGNSGGAASPVTGGGGGGGDNGDLDKKGARGFKSPREVGALALTGGSSDSLHRRDGSGGGGGQRRHKSDEKDRHDSDHEKPRDRTLGKRHSQEKEEDKVRPPLHLAHAPHAHPRTLQLTAPAGREDAGS
jgi:hypothetical protein